MTNDFYPVTPIEIKKQLKELSFDWWICGGWALELYAGEQIREHHDMDIAILRKDQFKLKEQLPDWEFKIAKDGVLYDWDEHELDSTLHAIWARKIGHEKWMTEFLLNESFEGNWVFRKNHEVSYPLDKIGLDIDTIPVLIPIIPLLFKSAHCNEKDNLDFYAVNQKLDLNSKKKLREWIKIFQPKCRWINDLENSLNKK